jgi:hypothetical protein
MEGGGRRDQAVQVGDGRVALASPDTVCHTVSIYVPWPAREEGEGHSVLSIVVRDTLRLRISPGRDSLLYQEIQESEGGRGWREGEGGWREGGKSWREGGKRRRLDSPPPLPPPRPQRRVQRRRKNLFRHLGLEGGGPGAEALLRVSLGPGEEGRGRKDLAKFLGVEEAVVMAADRSLCSSSCSSIPSYSTIDSSTSSRTYSVTSSEGRLSTKM